LLLSTVGATAAVALTVAVIRAAACGALEAGAALVLVVADVVGVGVCATGVTVTVVRAGAADPVAHPASSPGAAAPAKVKPGRNVTKRH